MKRYHVYAGSIAGSNIQHDMGTNDLAKAEHTAWHLAQDRRCTAIVLDLAQAADTPREVLVNVYSGEKRNAEG